MTCQGTSTNLKEMGGTEKQKRDLSLGDESEMSGEEEGNEDVELQSENGAEELILLPTGECAS